MTNRYQALTSATLGSLLLFLGACGGGSSNVTLQEVITANADSSNTGQRSDIESEPPLAAAFLSDPVTFDPLEVFPQIIELRQSAVSGLLVGYTAETQSSYELSFFEQAWSSMQDCLSVKADAPLIVVKSDSIDALSSEDDVIFDFNGRIIASANDAGQGASLQLLESELSATGNQAAEGFTLRSIMGRYLWRNNGLPERDYKYECASGAG